MVGLTKREWIQEIQLWERVIPLLGPIIEALEPVRKDIGRVFPDWHPDTVSHRFREIATDCGVNARLHDLRHTFASRFYRRTRDWKSLQEIMGHSDISTTMRIYAHLDDETRIKAMERFENGKA